MNMNPLATNQPLHPLAHEVGLRAHETITRLVRRARRESAFLVSICAHSSRRPPIRLSGLVEFLKEDSSHC